MTEPTHFEPALLRVSDPYIEGMSDDEMRALIERCSPHYPPTEEAKRRHESVRTHLRVAADRLIDLCPPSSERDQAVWLLMNDVMFYANAAIARNHGDLEPKPCVRPDCPAHTPPTGHPTR